MNNRRTFRRARAMICVALALPLAFGGVPATSLAQGTAKPGAGDYRAPPKPSKPGCVVQGSAGSGPARYVEICPGESPRELSPGAENPGGTAIGSAGAQPLGGAGVGGTGGVGAALAVLGGLGLAAAAAAAAGGGGGDDGGGGGGGGGGSGGGGGGANMCAANTRAMCCTATSPGSAPIGCSARSECGCPQGTSDTGATSCGPGQPFGSCRQCRC